MSNVSDLLLGIKEWWDCQHALMPAFLDEESMEYSEINRLENLQREAGLKIKQAIKQIVGEE